jgi:hypothetical protein
MDSNKTLRQSTDEATDEAAMEAADQATEVPRHIVHAAGPPSRTI